MASGGAVKAHPKWSSTEGFDPSASTLATLRSSWLSYGCMFCGSVAPPVRGATRDEFLKITHRRHSAGEFTAARSLLWRSARMPFAVVCRSGPARRKTKRPGSISESGPLVRELGRYAPTRYLHPDTADPHTVQATMRPGSTGSSAANASWMSSDCDHHKTRRARTPGPMRVECSMRSGLLSRWFQLSALFSMNRCWVEETGRNKFVDGCNVNWVYCTPQDFF